MAEVRRVRPRRIALSGGAIHQRHHSGMLVGESNRGNSGQTVRVSKPLDSSVAAIRPAWKLSGDKLPSVPVERT